jgi:class 3 adenylate cyclase
MTSIPTGIITFLFTDIEDSVKLWQEFPAQMPVNLARHDTLLRAAIEQNDGYVFKTVGDEFCAAFSTALQGVKAAIAAQKLLADENWGECVIKVRRDCTPATPNSATTTISATRSTAWRG